MHTDCSELDQVDGVGHIISLHFLLEDETGDFIMISVLDFEKV